MYTTQEKCQIYTYFQTVLPRRQLFLHRNIRKFKSRNASRNSPSSSPDVPSSPGDTFDQQQTMNDCLTTNLGNSTIANIIPTDNTSVVTNIDGVHSIGDSNASMKQTSDTNINATSEAISSTSTIITNMR